MKTFRVALALLVIGFSFALCAAVSAAQPTPDQTKTVGATTKSTNKAEPSQKKARALPFQGKIKALNKAAGTISIGERTFLVTAESKILKRDKTPASLAAVAVGEHVTGSYRKAEDGRLFVNTLYIGPKEGAETTSPPKTSPKKETGKGN